MFSTSEVFISSSLRMCSIEIEGVSGSLPVHAIGTARFLVQCSDASWIICLVHNALLTNGRHNLLSLSQLLTTTYHGVRFVSPAIVALHERSPTLSLLACPLHAVDGLYSLPARMVSINDPCVSDFPMIELTAPDPYDPPASTSLWSCRVLVVPIEPSFRDALQSFAESYIAPIAIPPSRRTYVASSVSDMAALSTRFMGVAVIAWPRRLPSLWVYPLAQVECRLCCFLKAVSSARKLQLLQRTK